MNLEENPFLLSLNDEQLAELEGLAGMNYFVSEMAMFFNVPETWLNARLEDETSKESFHFQRGKLLARAKLDIALQKSAEAGNVNAIQALMKRNKEAEMQEFRQNLLK